MEDATSDARDSADTELKKRRKRDAKDDAAALVHVAPKKV